MWSNFLLSFFWIAVYCWLSVMYYLKLWLRLLFSSKKIYESDLCDKGTLPGLKIGCVFDVINSPSNAFESYRGTHDTWAVDEGKFKVKEIARPCCYKSTNLIFAMKDSMCKFHWVKTFGSHIYVPHILSINARIILWLSSASVKANTLLLSLNFPRLFQPSVLTTEQSPRYKKYSKDTSMSFLVSARTRTRD